MSRLKPLVPVAFAVAVGLFFYALIQILLLRYERGDVYPAYSTFRTDPLGTRAYYEALNATGLFQASRGLTSLRRELGEKPETFFLIGLDPDELPSFTPTEIEELDDFVEKGGRVVITFRSVQPGDATAPEKKTTEVRKTVPTPGNVPSPPGPAGPPRTEQEKFERDQFEKDEKEREKISKGSLPEKFEPSLPARWGFGWTFHGSGHETGPEAGAAFSASGDVLAERGPALGTEEEVPWKSAAYFVRLDPAWAVDYRARDLPVFIECQRGGGQIVIASDSYFLSNEAMRNDRRPQLLSLVAGTGRHLLFDEVHLGTEEQEGVMTLARHFRLEGYLYGMLIVAALFLWRNSVPLIPPAAAPEGPAGGGAVSGKDSRAGLVNLLRRNIAPGDLLRACFTEWQRAHPPRDSTVIAKAAAMEAALGSSENGGQGGLVTAYHQLREINTGSRQKARHATRN